MSVSSPFIHRPIATSLLGIAVMLGGALGYMIYDQRRTASEAIERRPAPAWGRAGMTGSDTGKIAGRGGAGSFGIFGTRSPSAYSLRSLGRDG